MSIFKDADFEIYGVDLNEKYLNYGIKKGLNLKKGSIKELREYPKKANLIIASHILEHLHRIDEYLKDLWNYLEDDGFLYVELPEIFNQDNFIDFFVIEHLNKKLIKIKILFLIINLLVFLRKLSMALNITISFRKFSRK